MALQSHQMHSIDFLSTNMNFVSDCGTSCFDHDLFPLTVSSSYSFSPLAINHSIKDSISLLFNRNSQTEIRSSNFFSISVTPNFFLKFGFSKWFNVALWWIFRSLTMPWVCTRRSSLIFNGIPWAQLRLSLNNAVLS